MVVMMNGKKEREEGGEGVGRENIVKNMKK